MTADVALDALRVRITLECQTCGTRHAERWPYLRRCPACAVKFPGPPRRLSADAHGNGRYEGLPGDAETIIAGRITEAMLDPAAQRALLGADGVGSAV